MGVDHHPESAMLLCKSLSRLVAAALLGGNETLACACRVEEQHFVALSMEDIEDTSAVEPQFVSQLVE